MFHARTERLTAWLLGSAVVVNVVDWLAILRFAPRTETISPIHYTIYFGINLTGPWTMLFWLPAIGTAAIVTHLLIGWLNDQPVWRQLWMFLALALNTLVLADTAAILYLIRTYSL